MVAVNEFSWEEAMSPDFGTPARAAWREAVAEIAAKAKATLPQCHGRVDSAVKIVLAGDVELLAEGKAKVASQSNGQVVYHVVNGACSCKDYPKAPSGGCKHRIAAGLYKRATALVQHTLNGASNGASNGLAEVPSQAVLPEPPAPLAPLPEVPAIVSATITVEGRRVELKLSDSDDTRLLQRLTRLLAQYPSDPPTFTPPAADIPQCPTHGAKKSSRKGQGWYCPRKLSDGSWCKGK